VILFSSYLLLHYKDNNDHVYKNIHLIKQKSALFGFSIKGGQKKPVGIFVTHIDPDGPAGEF
jgi:hypothetical protein